MSQGRLALDVVCLSSIEIAICTPDNVHTAAAHCCGRWLHARTYDLRTNSDKQLSPRHSPDMVSILAPICCVEVTRLLVKLSRRWQAFQTLLLGLSLDDVRGWPVLCRSCCWMHCQCWLVGLAEEQLIHQCCGDLEWGLVLLQDLSFHV